MLSGRFNTAAIANGSVVLTTTDIWISWSIIGAVAGAISYLSRRNGSDILFGRMFDGVLGACVGGEIIRRWDPAMTVSGAGLLAAAAGSILFLVVIGRLRTT